MRVKFFTNIALAMVVAVKAATAVRIMSSEEETQNDLAQLDEACLCHDTGFYNDATNGLAEIVAGDDQQVECPEVHAETEANEIIEDSNETGEDEDEIFKRKLREQHGEAIKPLGAISRVLGGHSQKLKNELNELRQIECCKKCSCIFKDRMVKNMQDYENVIGLYNQELAKMKSKNNTPGAQVLGGNVPLSGTPTGGLSGATIGNSIVTPGAALSGTTPALPTVNPVNSIGTPVPSIAGTPTVMGGAPNLQAAPILGTPLAGTPMNPMGSSGLPAASPLANVAQASPTPVLQTPSLGGIAGVPTAGGLAGIPSAGGLAGVPTAGGLAGVPTAGGLAGVPTAGGLAGVPTAGGLAGVPTAGGLAGVPTAGGLAGVRSTGVRAGVRSAGGLSGGSLAKSMTSSMTGQGSRRGMKPSIASKPVPVSKKQAIMPLTKSVTNISSMASQRKPAGSTTISKSMLPISTKRQGGSAALAESVLPSKAKTGAVSDISQIESLATKDPLISRLLSEKNQKTQASRATQKQENVLLNPKERVKQATHNVINALKVTEAVDKYVAPLTPKEAQKMLQYAADKEAGLLAVRTAYNKARENAVDSTCHMRIARADAAKELAAAEDALKGPKNLDTLGQDEDEQDD